MSSAATPLPKLQLGAACAGFQCEGGYNGPGQPWNNWAGWEGRKGFEPAGDAVRFWERWREDVALLAEHGLHVFRFSLEWARLLPSREGGALPSELDAQALGNYADLFQALHLAGIESLPTLFHWTYPAPLGRDLWLRDEAPRLFASWLERLLPALLDALEARGTPPPRRWLTLNEPNMYAVATHLAGRFPHERPPSAEHARRALELQLLGHLEAVRVVRAAYAARGLPAPQLSFNPNLTTFFRADLGLFALLDAKRQGVAREELGAFLDATEARIQAAFLPTEPSRSPFVALARMAVRALEPGVARSLGPQGVPQLVEAVYRLEESAFDWVAFDYYDPFPWNLVGLSTPGNGRGMGPMVDEWAWQPHPTGLTTALEQAALCSPGREVWVAENGMALRGLGERVFGREDQTRRDDFLTAHVKAVREARRRGVPVGGYLHWSLWDNYEWGSWQPRFGLIGMDGKHGRIERHARDAGGVEALAAFGRLAREEAGDSLSK